ncbi:uncharacterized protein LOC143793118 [Ranitomeya variabilis]|uniref:uncharacterized protein LOC143793118 n=1 Tax=Ranitomeya variabilis TaxID=490064 RepID=UPI0040560123
MVIFILLCLLLPGGGIWCLTGPSTAAVRSGNSMTVRCVYDGGYEDYIKYWCKGENARSCIIQIKTETHKKEMSMGRFTIKDTPATHSFNVIMVNMSAKDSDIYYCGIERNLMDNMHMMKVEVLPGVCPVTAPWTDIVNFPPSVTEIEADEVVEASCQKRYQQKNVTLQCREASGEFVLSPQSDGDYCVGVCPVTAPWTDIVNFPPNITEIEADEVVEVSCQKRYQQKNVTLQCREASGEFVLSPQSDGDYCVGVCRKSPRWSHIVDFPENFTEIAVNGSVLVSCPQTYGGQMFRLQCREDSGEFLLSEADGLLTCVDHKMSTLTSQARSLLLSSFGLVVPFLLKLAALLVSLVGKISGILLRRLQIYREGVKYCYINDDNHCVAVIHVDHMVYSKTAATIVTTE